ncbi:MAG: sigma-54-dependent Fis family transcriptional regulator [Candidatus Poribacteria bacterium]|nr:MAG: sigma-54-dependent Fis family transcriptional regulator [Candidatus Poribacteria bacterium]
MRKVLIIEDDTRLAWTFQEFLAEEGYAVLLAGTAEEGLRLVEAERPDIVLCDVRLPGMNGLQALQAISSRHPDAYVIVMTAYGTAQTAIEAIQHGAYDYLPKPVELEQLRGLLQRIEKTDLARRRAEGVGPIGTSLSAGPVQLVGQSPAMQEIYKLIGMLTTNRVTVLIEGESGTGKELVARAIHANSPWAGEPFLAVNCGALAETLLESELFGYEKGAFTGATRQSPGKLEAAGEGTLFLDEVGSMSPALQVKLLRAIQEREFQRVGGTTTLPVRARIIAATNVSLERLVAEGSFREDLYYRLKVVSVSLPPLRERREDIPLLVQHFLGRVSEELGRPIRTVDPETMRLLEAYSWPGNVRELENAVRRAAVFARGGVLLPEHLPPEVQRGTPLHPPGSPGPEERLAALLRQLAERAPAGSVYQQLVAQLDRTLIRLALERSGGNQVQAAQWLGISRTTLRKRLEELNLSQELAE